jgi:membrane protein GlpM
MASLFLRALIGAAAVVVIALLSRGRSYFVAGLVPLFPTFALIAHYVVGSERPAADLRTTVLFGTGSLVPYFVYLAAVYVLIARHRLVPTLAVATLLWLVAAAILVTAWMRLHRAGA